MLEDDGSPNTAHSMNPVPIVITADVGEDYARDPGGRVADDPGLLGQEQPRAMTGRSLLDG